MWSYLEGILTFLVWLLIQLSATEAAVGFTPEPTVYKLVFEEDTPLHGLVVKATPCTIGEWNDMLRGSGTRETSAEVAEANDKIGRMFIDHVVEWDLELPKGSPVPVTYEGFQTVDNNYGSLMIAAWQFAMTSVPKPSKEKSNSSATSEEQSLGLGSLSESLPNWQQPT